MTPSRPPRAPWAALAALALLAAGCAPASPTPTAAGRALSVVATTTQVQDFVRNVAGDRATVVGILGPGVDPHDYQPTADDARKLAQADVVFANGVGGSLEPWLAPLAKNARPGVPVVPLADAAHLSIKTGDPDAGGEGDPHVWQDPTNARKMVDVIRDTLATADPPGSGLYQTNAAAYQAQLAQLDQQIKQQIETIPPDQRKLVTNHDAFMYYVDRYGLTFVGSVIPSLSTEAEPSAADTRKLIEEIKAQRVKAIFTEHGLNPRLEEQIAQEAGVRVDSSLYGDALGEPGSDGDTYIKAMQHNTRAIVEGLR